MNKKGPIVLIILSGILIIGNFVIAGLEGFDHGFWLRSISSVLLILAMLLSIRHQKNKE